MLKQLSVLLENKDGALAKVAAVLSENNFKMLGFSLVDTTEYGILRIVTDKTQEAIAAFRGAGFTANKTSVVAEICKENGDMEKAFLTLSENHISIEYVYNLAADPQVIVIKVNDAAAAEEILSGKGIRLLGEETLLA